RKKKAEPIRTSETTAAGYGLTSKAGELVHHLGEAAPLVVREIGRGDIEAVVFQAGRLGETVPGGRLGHIFWQRPAGYIEMCAPILRDRVAAGRGGEEDLRRLGLVLLHALAVEQHDRIFDLAGDDAVVRRALEPVSRLFNILRRPFAVAQHHAV